MEDEQSVDAQVGKRIGAGIDRSAVVIDFAVGPDGVGPVMGFDSDDFFKPPAPAPLENDESSG